MPERATALTGSAGEHFVAYKLSAFGYPVALTRGGSPTIDLMVGDLSGNAAVSIQVKTDNWARREYKRKPQNNHWEWYVNPKVLTLVGESIFYAFVDLKWNPAQPLQPDVFILPSKEVAGRFTAGWKMYRFWLMDNEKEKWFEAWHLITDRLHGEQRRGG